MDSLAATGPDAATSISGVGFSAFGLLAALVLVGLNGFFVAAEFAIVKVRRTRLEELAGKGVPAARASIVVVDQLDEYLSATQLGITLVSLALGWVGEETFAGILMRLWPGIFGQGTYHALAAGLSFFVITMLHVVLGELVPKSMAIQDAEKIAMRVARPLSLFYTASRPLIHAFTCLANFVLRRLGYHGLEEPPLTEQELKLVMKESREEGVITESEAQIINSAFEFSDKRVGDIMVPAEKVNYISMARGVEENLETVRANLYSRYPVCSTDLQTVMGVVHMKDVWPIIVTERSNEAFLKAMRPATYVDKGVREDRLMKAFQNRAHMAIVTEASAGGRRNIGVVTLEDVLEELVGPIRDEHDTALD